MQKGRYAFMKRKKALPHSAAVKVCSFVWIKKKAVK